MTVSNSGFNVLASDDIVLQSSGNNHPRLWSSEKERSDYNFLTEEAKKPEIKGKNVQDKSDLSTPFTESETKESAQKPDIKTKVNNDLKLKVRPQGSWKEILLKKEGIPEHKSRGNLRQKNLIKPNERFFSKTHQNVGNTRQVDQRVLSEKNGLEKLKSPLSQRTPFLIESNESSVSKKETNWVVVEKKPNRKGSSFSKQQNQVDESKEKFHSSNLENEEIQENMDESQENQAKTQENKDTPEIEVNNKAQESSRSSSSDDSKTSKPKSLDSLRKSKLDGLNSDYLPREIVSENPDEINPVPAEAGRKTLKKKQKKSSKKKDTAKKSVRQHNADTSNHERQAFSQEHIPVFGPSDLNVNHDSPLNRKHSIQAPLPEPAFVTYFESNKKPNLWESQLYASPVNPKTLVESLQQNAKSVLEVKWRSMEIFFFEEAFLPWKEGRAENNIYPDVPNPPEHLHSEKNELLEDELNQRLQKHLKLSDISQNLTLDNMGEVFFKMLREHWALDREGLMTKLNAMQNAFNDIQELLRRLLTLYRQILQHTIVENWKIIKSILVKTDQFSKIDVEDIETMFQLSICFPDVINPSITFNKRTYLVQKFKENKGEITSILEKLMGATEAEARIGIFEYLYETSKVPVWWQQTDYLEQYRGNGLNLWHVFSIGKTLSFDNPDFEVPKEKASQLFRTIQSTYISPKARFLPWFASPERAFTKKITKEKYETRMKQLLDMERQHNYDRDLHAVALRHKTNGGPLKVVTLQHEDIWNFYHRGLSPQYMAEMYVAGAGRAESSTQRWKNFLGRAPNLLSYEQSSFAINWFISANPIIKDCAE
ncbi:hypothetical protein O181_087796 [Austropuccinia psidii MF-1]|uniref:Uncharacterized protein n=1 Tax=Austropuccinia psidii MF-1 TaxID=1389203 RepID=A0A9Q3IQB9_9BASI|nr:hypothetical protein [Austropuccinia psidii MF-1]